MVFISKNLVELLFGILSSWRQVLCLLGARSCVSLRTLPCIVAHFALDIVPDAPPSSAPPWLCGSTASLSRALSLEKTSKEQRILHVVADSLIDYTFR
jgi:hypothetical protein